jgi:hypothetical protein
MQLTMFRRMQKLIFFDGIIKARQVLHDPSQPGTPFDGGGGPLHAGPQAMTDGQTLPVI